MKQKITPSFTWSGIRLKQDNKMNLKEKMKCKNCSFIFYRWKFYRCPKCNYGH